MHYVLSIGFLEQCPKQDEKVGLAAQLAKHDGARGQGKVQVGQVNVHHEPKKGTLHRIIVLLQ